MAAVRFRQRRVRRWWYIGLTLAAAAVGAVILVGGASGASADLAGGCDFSPANNGTPSCLGSLAGSTFAGGDGNLLASPTTFGSTDWQNVSGLNTGFDLASGKTDNLFGQGAKEDDPNITVVTGSIPPNKSDLTRFYEASEFSTVNNHNFLYLGWERTNVLGTANFDFEINHQSQPNLTATGPATLVRTAGDLLVTYDFNNGGGRPAIGLLRWVTSASVPVVPGFATNTCFSANTFPCWGDQVTLDGTDSVAAVNNLDPVTDPIAPSGANYINPVPALQFGEVAIDLTKANVFPAGTCTAFGSTFVRSRSSTSFTAEIKDFIAPIPVNISNCGTINIIKHSTPRGIDQNFNFTSSIPNPAAGSSTPTCTLDSTPSSFALNDKNGVDPSAPITQGTANTEHCANVPAGSYTVTEGTEPSNFVLDGLSCSAGGAQDGVNAAQADITVSPGSTVTCTFTNKQQLGAIKITKTSIKGPALPGATFSITGPSSFSTSVTSGADGTVCVDHLPFGTYTVTETAAPSGYSIDDPSGHAVVVDTNSACGAGHEASFAATDSPLTDVLVKATSEAAGGTRSKITCVDASSADIGNSPQGFGDPVTVTANGLKPGTYTCTIVVDP